MNECFVIDITHYLDATGLLPSTLTPEAKQFIDGFGTIIASVTMQPSETDKTTVRIRYKSTCNPNFSCQ